MPRHLLSDLQISLEHLFGVGNWKFLRFPRLFLRNSYFIKPRSIKKILTEIVAQGFSVKKVAFKIFTKLTRKQLWRSRFFNKVAKWRRFPVNYPKTFHKTFCTEHLRLIQNWKKMSQCTDQEFWAYAQNTELILVRIFLYSDWIRYLYTFHAVFYE